MKKHLRSILIVFAAAVTLAGCRSSAVLAKGKLDTRISSRQVVRKHMEGKTDFNTISGRLAVNYEDGEASQNTTFSLRMKKDQVIWLSAPLGIVKVYISPNRVSFYNKLQNEYFDGDFSYLSELLGSDIDFEKLQNLLLGQAVMDLRNEKYKLQFTEEAYQLTPSDEQQLQKLMFLIEPGNFKLSSQLLAQPYLDRAMEVKYSSYQRVQGEVIPNHVQIEAVDAGSIVNIGIQYKQIELNRELRFPYKIPKGFNAIAKR